MSNGNARIWQRGWVFLLGLAWLSGGATRAEDPVTAPALPATAGPATAGPTTAGTVTPSTEATTAGDLAKRVVIYRDAFGVPHVDGQTDEATIFGFAFAQAEDNFWQIEDNYILSLGRWSEVHGPTGLNSDLLNRAFEIVPKSKATFAQLDPRTRSLYAAFVGGLNYYLATHPLVKPRMITHFEPWQVLAYGRHMTLELCFRYTRLSSNYLPRSQALIWPATGSNGWAIGPTRTKSGHAMLLVNPHLPWFGFGQMYEAHLRSGGGADGSESWNGSGGTTLGSPLLTLGHNEHLGWTFTTNEPDIADVWRETFDDPKDPLNYRYAGGYRKATEWRETIRVKGGGPMQEREFTLRKTHHGPIVVRDDGQHFLSARVAGLQDTVLLNQSLRMIQARDLGEFKAALALQQFPLMNVLYADRDGNIYFLYNGIVPRRDPQFNWSLPVDGSDPRTEWGPPHSLDELPQVLNPPAGYVQNCNSSPFTTCDQGNPDRAAFPRYMVEDADDDKRRAKISRQLLGEMNGLTFDGLEEAAFDTTVYWAQHEFPKLAGEYDQLRTEDPVLAAHVEPYWKHLLEWDCRVTAASTQATLCEAWYEELYGINYPAETLLPIYVAEPSLKFKALVRAAGSLSATHGKWRVPWGDVFRIQRRDQVADLLDLPFDDRLPSLPSVGAPGPMGVVFTQYYSPSLKIPLFKTLKKRYGMIGATYLGIYEFGERVRGATALNFGQSGDPKSPHFFDQAVLLSEQRLKPELFYWEDVKAAALQTYRPGEAPQAIATSK